MPPLKIENKLFYNTYYVSAVATGVEVIMAAISTVDMRNNELLITGSKAIYKVNNTLSSVCLSDDLIIHVRTLFSSSRPEEDRARGGS